MTQPNDPPPTADLIERALTSLRAATADLQQLAQHGDGIAALVHNAHGSAVLRALRLEINHLDELLPLKG